MNFKQRVENAIRGSKKSPLKLFHEISFILAKHIGWGYEDIMEAPIPFVFGILSEFEAYQKEKAKAYKKSNRR